MTKLYSELARVYHEMYQSIFNYQEDFGFYDKLLKKYNCKSVLEIGCGSGNLASYFLKAKYQYTGVDLSPAMLKIARRIEPKATFIEADMRQLKLKKQFDAAIITGKTISYMTKNSDVQRAMKATSRILKKGGILIFDGFNAAKVISLKKKQFEQKAEFKGRKYVRKSIKTPNLEHGWTENWKAKYTIKEKGKKTKVIEDDSILRSFTIDEITLFLNLQRFKILKHFDRDVTFVMLATKN